MNLKEFLESQKDLIDTEPKKMYENFEVQLKVAYQNLLSYKTKLEQIEKSYKKKVFDLFTVFDIGKDLNSTLDINTVMDVITFTCRAQMKSTLVHLLLLSDEDENQIVLKTSTYLNEEDKKDIFFNANEAFINFLQEYKKPISINELLKIDSIAYAKEKLELLNSILYIPLITKEKIIGLIALGKKKDGSDYTEDNYTFLSTIASFAASAFDNARLYTKVNHQLQLISGLYEISNIINTSTNLNEVLNMIMETITTGFQVDICAILLYEEETDKFVIKSSRGLSKETIKNYTPNLKKGPIAVAFELNEPLVITDFNEDEEFKNKFTDEDKTKFDEVLIVPLKAGERIVGVLNIYKFSIPKKFDEETKKLFIIISSQIAPAILMAKMIQTQKEMIIDPFSSVQNLIETEIKRASHIDFPFSIIVYKLNNFQYENIYIFEKNLKNCFRENDIVVRLNIDKYCVILPLTSKNEAIDISNKLSLPKGFEIVKNVLMYPIDGKNSFELLTKI